MNAYEMVSRVGRELHAYIFSSGIFPLNNVLAYLREGEMNVSSRLKWPIVRRKFDSVAGVAEYRLGATENRMESPVLDDLIIGVRVKDSSSSAFGEPLELTTLDFLDFEGVDVSQTSVGGSPQYAYWRYDETALGPSGVLGIYPPPTASVEDGIEVSFVPVPATPLYCWGTGISSVTTTATVTAGSATVTLSAATADIATGLSFGIVDQVGELPRRWYQVTALTGAGPTYTQFTISPVYGGPGAGAGKKFVLSSYSALGRQYPGHIYVACLHAAYRLAGDQGNPEEQATLAARYERGLVEFKKALFRGGV